MFTNLKQREKIHPFRKRLYKFFRYKPSMSCYRSPVKPKRVSEHYIHTRDGCLIKLTMPLENLKKRRKIQIFWGGK